MDKQNTIKATVVIPCFNSQKTLERAVLSVLNQSEKARVLVVNDGSTDRSLPLARWLAKDYPAWVEVLDAGVNHGAGMARNMGALYATTPYLAFLDADDAYTPDFIRLMSAVLDQYPHVAAVRSGIDIEGFSDIAEDDGSYVAICQTYPGNMLVRKHVFLFSGGFAVGEFHQFWHGEDAPHRELLLRYFNVAILAQKLVILHDHPNSYTREFLLQAQGQAGDRLRGERQLSTSEHYGRFYEATLAHIKDSLPAINNALDQLAKN